MWFEQEKPFARPKHKKNSPWLNEHTQTDWNKMANNICVSAKFYDLRQNSGIMKIKLSFIYIIWVTKFLYYLCAIYFFFCFFFRCGCCCWWWCWIAASFLEPNKKSKDNARAIQRSEWTKKNQAYKVFLCCRLLYNHISSDSRRIVKLALDQSDLVTYTHQP